MANEKFTDLPTVSNSELTDIICAVQGYQSPSILGTSTQQTLAQVLALVSSSIIVANAGNPNGAVAGTAYNLCWDSVNHILYICTTSGSSVTAVWNKVIQLTQGSGITISQNGNSIVISASGLSFSWNNVSGSSATMVSNNGYVSNNSGLVSLTLPTTSTFGDILYIVGAGAGGWSILQNSGQQIFIGSSSSTIGVGGSVSSTNRYDSLALVCTQANNHWNALGAPQSSGLTIV